MEKIQFTDPDTNEVVEFAVEEQTQLNFLRRMQCRKDTRLRMRRTPRWFIRTTIR